MSTLDADALATLTPEERAAIESPDMSPDELQAMQRLADSADGDDDGDEGDEGDEGDDDDDDDDAADDPAAGAAADAAAVPAAADADAGVADRTAAQPRYDARLPADYDAKVQDLADREAEIKRQFRSGEIEFDEFEAQRSTLLIEREALTIARTKAEISQEMTAQTAEQQWRSTVNTFLDATTLAGGPNYRTDAEKMGDLDLFVKTLAARPELANKPAEWFLAEADRRVRALHGLTTPEPPRADPVADATARRRVDPSAAPRTLAQVPGSDGPGDVGSEFADVDALEGDALESAISRMTPAQREKFARAR
jgi:hypothetical protein